MNKKINSNISIEEFLAEKAGKKLLWVSNILHEAKHNLELHCEYCEDKKSGVCDMCFVKIAIEILENAIETMWFYNKIVSRCEYMYRMLSDLMAKKGEQNACS